MHVCINTEALAARSCISSTWPETWSGLLDKHDNFSTAISDKLLIDWPEGPPVGILKDWDNGQIPSYSERTIALIRILAKQIKPRISEILTEHSELRISVVIATSHGDPGPISSLVRNKIIDLEPTLLNRISNDDLSQPIHDVLGKQLPVTVISAACASALVATQFAFKRIKHMNSDAVIIFSVDTLSLIAYTGFNRVGAMSKTGTRPFDIHRDGMTASEGGVAFLIINEDYIKDKNKIRILGGSNNCDNVHMVEPSVKGISSVLNNSSSQIKLKSSDISFVYWHGTGTILNDKSEAEVAKLFFEHNVPPGCSTKGCLGHTMGASGAFNILGACNTLLTRILPPTGRLISPAFDFMNVSPNPLFIDGDIGMCLALGFGGINAVIILQKCLDK